MKKNNVLISLLFLGLITSGLVLGSTLLVKAKILQNTNLKLTSKDELCKSDFQVGGLKLTDSVSDVIKIYGTPQKMVTSEENETIIYNYKNFIATFGKRSKKMNSIEINKEGILTFRGLGINSEEKDVIKYYGNTEKYENKYLIYSKVMTENDFDCEYTIEFTIVDKKVKKIHIYFAAD